MSHDPLPTLPSRSPRLAPRAPTRATPSLTALAMAIGLVLGACGSSDGDPAAAIGDLPQTGIQDGDTDATGDGLVDDDGGGGVLGGGPGGGPDQGAGQGADQDVDRAGGGADNADGGQQGGQQGNDTLNSSGDPLAYERWDGVGDLPPLPDPPLSPAPDAASEPIPETRPITALSSVFTVADPQGRIVDTDAPRLGDADFEAGPLPAVLSVPPGVDVSANRPPFFVNLVDREVFAGDTLEILLDPDDPDGGFPGMFPENLPAGAEYIDNLDGTRTLRWRPLQPDVGVTEFTIVAVDASEPLLRSARTVRIRVSMPADPSGIRNLRPGINQVQPHVTRVGDTVVLELKGTDPNGTIPDLALPNLPQPYTFVPHRTEPGMKVLRFVADEPGPIDLLVEARDAADPSLTLQKTFRIDVLPPESFALPGERLRTFARQRDLILGFAAGVGFYARPDTELYTDIAAAEFDMVTAENAMKSDLVNPLPGVYRWAQADNLLAWATSENLAVRGHTLVWYFQVPAWLTRTDPATREGHMREYIDRVMTRYRGRIPVWDVVNEVFEDDGSFRNSVWYQGMGERHVEIAFRQARLSDPAAILLYNDYDVLTRGPKADAMFTMLGDLVARGVPVDGVGFQMHVDADFDRFDEVRENLRRAEALGLEVWVTELDVSIRPGQTEAQQAAVFEGLLQACLDAPACRAFQLWGFTDMYSWRRDFSPLPLDERYAPKPAWLALQRRLGGG